MKTYLSFLTSLVSILALVLSSCTKEEKQSSIQVEEVILSAHEIHIIKGQEIQLTTRIYPQDAEIHSEKWFTDNDYVSVDENGKITGNEVGQSIVTYLVDDIAASCKVHVEPAEILPESIIIFPEEMELNYGKYAYLTFGIQPKNATETTLTWESEDSNIVEVNQDGRIKGTGLGTTTVSATTVNGLKASCRVTIIGQVIEDFILVYSGIEPGIGEMKYQHVYEIIPEEAIDISMTWTSEDESVATVEYDEAGRRAIITGISEGYTNIIATANAKPELIRTTWVNVVPQTNIPYRFGWEWVLNKCEFRVGEETKSEKSYLKYLQDQEGMSAEEAEARVDLLERYFAISIHDENTRDYLTLTLTTEDGSQYSGQTLEFKQIRDGYEINDFEATFDLSAAPAELSDLYSKLNFHLFDIDNYWTQESYFEQYGVTVIYTWKSYGASILDK